MTRTLKTLGLTLVAIFAMSAMVASAQAGEGKFRFQSATQLLKVEQDGIAGSAAALQQFTTTSGTVQCGEEKGEATVLGEEATEVTIQNLRYQNAGKTEQCTGTFEPTVKFNGCGYKLAAGETIGQTGMETTGTVAIECPLGKQIVIQAPLCTIKISAQNQITGHIIYHTNTATKNDVTLEVTVEGIGYTGSGVCTSGINGRYNGNATLRAFTFESITQQSIEVH